MGARFDLLNREGVQKGFKKVQKGFNRFKVHRVQGSTGSRFKRFKGSKVQRIHRADLNPL
jgi:hypothetical protein